MEKTEKSSLDKRRVGLINPAFYLQLVSDIMDLDPSPPLIAGGFRIEAVRFDVSSPETSPSPELNSPSGLNRREPKTEKEHVKAADYKFMCPECSKPFATEKAMFGHMRIHRDRSCKRSKKRSISKPEPDRYIDRLLAASWAVKGKRGRKPLLDKKSPDVDAALILMDVSKYGDERLQKKRRIEESEPLDENKYICELCNKSFSSHQALGGHRSSHKKARDNAAFVQPSELPRSILPDSAKKKAKSRVHVCKTCGASYPTGHQLGGHKRAHYNKEPAF